MNRYTKHPLFNQNFRVNLIKKRATLQQFLKFINMPYDEIYPPVKSSPSKKEKKNTSFTIELFAKGIGTIQRSGLAVKNYCG